MPDRIEREIEEILDKIDQFVPEEKLPVRLRRRAGGTFHGLGTLLVSPLTRVSVAQLMLLGLGLFILSFFLGQADSTLGRWAAIVGAVLFLGGFVLSLLSGRVHREPKRWRGRVVEYNEPDITTRLRSWFRARRGPRRQPPR